MREGARRAQVDAELVASGPLDVASAERAIVAAQARIRGRGGAPAPRAEATADAGFEEARDLAEATHEEAALVQVGLRRRLAASTQRRAKDLDALP